MYTSLIIYRTNQASYVITNCLMEASLLWFSCDQFSYSKPLKTWELCKGMNTAYDKFHRQIRHEMSIHRRWNKKSNICQRGQGKFQRQKRHVTHLKQPKHKSGGSDKNVVPSLHSTLPTAILIVKTWQQMSQILAIRLELVDCMLRVIKYSNIMIVFLCNWLVVSVDRSL